MVSSCTPIWTGNVSEVFEFERCVFTHGHSVADRLVQAIENPKLSYGMQFASWPRCNRVDSQWQIGVERPK